MIVTCWSVKGGSGTSVVAAGLAVGWARPNARCWPSISPATYRTCSAWPHPTGPGVDRLVACRQRQSAPRRCRRSRSTPDRACGCCTAGGNGWRPPAIRRADVPDGRWEAFTEAMATASTDVVIDAGLAPLPPSWPPPHDASLLVIRPVLPRHCAAAGGTLDVPAGVVVIGEPGRALRTRRHRAGARHPDRRRDRGSTPRCAAPSTPACSLPRLPAASLGTAKAVGRWADGPAVAGRRPAAEPLPDSPPTAVLRRPPPGPVGRHGARGLGAANLADRREEWR